MIRAKRISSQPVAVITAVSIGLCALLAPAVSNAQGEQVITLSCLPASASPPFVLKLELNNKTVSGDGQYGWDPQKTIPLMVTNDEFSWVVPGDSVNTLSRVTGSFLSVGIGTSTGGRWSSQCHKGERQF